MCLSVLFMQALTEQDKRKAAKSSQILRFDPMEISWDSDDNVYWFDYVVDTPFKYIYISGPPDVEGAYQKVIEWYDCWLEDAAAVQAYQETKRFAALLAHGKQNSD